MPIFKSAVTFCVLLLLTLVLHGPVIAQSEEPKFEVGAQFSVIGKGAGGAATDIGGGGRLTFNLTKYLALEGELNYFPSAGFDNVRRFQGQFGVKSGLRLDRFGVFGKVRPGFIKTKSRFTTCRPCPPGVFCIQGCFPVDFNYAAAEFPAGTEFPAATEFSLDVGGVVEFYPARRITMRFDVGDTIVNRREAPILIPISFPQAPPILIPISFPQAPPNLSTFRLFAVPGGNVATHNLQLSAGIGFRF